MILIVCIFFVSVFVATRYFSFRKSSDNCSENLYEIPCPGAVPILGNTIDIFRSSDDLWQISRKRALENFPIYRQKIFNNNIVYVMHPEDIEVILADVNNVKKGALYDSLKKIIPRGLVLNDEESWFNRRKILKKAFNFSNVQKYISLFNKEISSFVFRLEENLNEQVDINYHIHNLIFRMSNATAIGNQAKITDEEAEDYIDSIKTLTEIMLIKATKPHLNILWPFLELKKRQDEAINKIKNHISKILENYVRLNSTEDCFNAMDLLLNNPDIFDKETVEDEINTFILASQDTTSTALSFILMALANYPKHQDTIYEEIQRIAIEHQNPTYSDLTSMDYLDRFVKECLRLYTPFIMMERTLKKEMTTKTGYKLPAGTVVIIPLLDIHRNPNLYPDPEKFDPDRFLLDNVGSRHPFSFMPFSAGPKRCIAQKFAVLTLKASICGILQNFKLEPGTKIENMEYSLDVILQVRGGIKVKFTKR